MKRQQGTPCSIGLLATAMLVAVTGCATLFSADQKAVNLATRPAAADVYVNGIYKGKTPVRLVLDNHKTHDVRFELAGHHFSTCKLTAKLQVKRNLSTVERHIAESV